MSRYAVTWTGTIAKTLPVQTPADCLYHVWSRYREDMAAGDLSIRMEDGGKGVRLAHLSFPAVIRREIEAEDAVEAIRAMTYDDRMPPTIHLSQITVETIADQPMLELVEAA